MSICIAMLFLSVVERKGSVFVRWVFGVAGGGVRVRAKYRLSGHSNPPHPFNTLLSVYRALSCSRPPTCLFRVGRWAAQQGTAGGKSKQSQNGGTHVGDDNRAATLYPQIMRVAL